jgi:hypothetical protein
MPEIVRPDSRAVVTASVTVASAATSKSATNLAPPGICAVDSLASATSSAKAAAVVASGAADVSLAEANAPGRRQQVQFKMCCQWLDFYFLFVHCFGGVLGVVFCVVIINNIPPQLSAATVVHRGKAPTAFTAAAFQRYGVLCYVLFPIIMIVPQGIEQK